MAEFLKDAEDSSEKSGDAGDQEFEPSAEMLIHDYDDEQTLAEEEAIAIAEGEDPQSELNDLQKESDMPLEELLAMYPRPGDQPPEKLPDDDAEEMEEDDDESVESSSSNKSKTEVQTGEKPGKKAQSELHLLYPEEAVPRLLRSAGAGNAVSDEEGDEEEDQDYAPGEDEWRKTIMIGSEYQSSVPSGLSPYDNLQTVPYENEDKLLWTPYVLADGVTQEYLERCAQIQQEQMRSRINSSTPPMQTMALLASLPMGAHVRDDEQALHQLLQCGYNVEEALRRRKISTVTPCDTVSLWSEEECRNFESGLRIFGKDFHLIQTQKVRTRSVGELVQFYYLWKKTERHDVLANRARLEKKKYSLHPGTTDYMDRFLDEQESAVNVAASQRERSNSRSNSPSVNSLMYGDPKRLRTTATPPVGIEEAANGLPAPEEDGVGMADSENGQVLTAAAAAAAASATVLPSSPAENASARDIIS